MSITLDVNAFLNKDVCEQGCDNHMAMEKEMETNIFDEIEHLLKFNKNLEYEQQNKDEPPNKQKKQEESKNHQSAAVNLDFLNSTSDDFLLTSDSQSLLGEDALLFTVEQDRLQPISSRFMVPGIYKRIEGVATNDNNNKKITDKSSNVFISELEKQGRIVKQDDFRRLYIMADECTEACLQRVLLVESMESDSEVDEQQVDNNHQDQDKQTQRESGSESRAKDTIPKEWDALNRLAYDILKLTNRDHIVIDRKNNEIIRTQFNTQQKTIYRFLAPEMLGLKVPSRVEDSKINCNLQKEDKLNILQKSKNKLGRPRKTAKEDDGPIKSSMAISNKEDNSFKSTIQDNKTITKKNNLRTRSGRLVKPTSSSSSSTIENEITNSTQESLKTLLNDLKDSDYHGSSKLNHLSISSTDMDTTNAATIESSTKRKIPPEAICPTCKKIFLGRRLQRHFTQHPDHMKSTTATTLTDTNRTNFVNSTVETTQSSEDMSLFKFLISKLQTSHSLNEDQKADLFLNELNNLVEQLQLRSSRLIRNTSGLHFVNQRCSKLLGIPEGQYALDLTAIEQPIDLELQTNYETNSNSQTQHLHSQPNHILNSRSLDYTSLSITLDDTLTDEAAQKLNLSAGGKLLPPSEESLLRAVGDLVQTDTLNKIHTSSMLHQQQQQPVANNPLSSSCSSSINSSEVANHLPPHIDHASDNAVEAVNMKETSTNVNSSENPLLDLSVDFFQFNN